MTDRADDGVTEELSVPVRFGPDLVEGSLVVARRASGDVALALTLPDRATLQGVGFDLLAALDDLRAAVEAQGGLLWVNGARANVHASGMLRDARDGRLAYVLPEQRVQDRPPVTDVLLGAGPDDPVVSLAEQQVWFARYLARSD
ncbi:MAG: hypothetical protein JWO76_2309 [Nocardioides sp.]|nr:hypothetical protein [Nocardioides sp.]